MNDPAAEGAQVEVRIGEWRVHPTLNRIQKQGVTVDLEPKLMDLLVCLAEYAGEVVSKEELLDSVWQVEHVSDGTLSHAIAELRRALGDDARHPRYIETIRKRGYRLVAAVELDHCPGVTALPPTAPPRRPMVFMIVAAASVLAAIVAWFVADPWKGGPTPPPRIVVLPFESIGGGPSDSFAAGLSDEIISRLAAVRGLQVVSRTTAFNLDDDGMSARDIGDELGVDYILEGAVRWSTDPEPATVRITPQLIRVDDDGHLWSAAFDRHPEDILDVQSEIALQIVAQLDLRLATEESEVVETPPTDNPVAYRAFLEALERRSSYDERDILVAAQMYRRAVEADPRFAQAWAGLAEANGAIHHFGYDRSPDRCQTARDALDQARSLAPKSPATMRAAAYFAYHCRAETATARDAFQQTLDAWPGDAVAMKGMAYACRRMGDHAEAERWFRHAMELDPHNPTVAWNLGATIGLDHRYGEALELVDRAIELGPDNRFAHFAKSVILWLGWGDVERAAEVLDRAPGPRDATWNEYVFRNAFYAGDLDTARRIAAADPPGPMSVLQKCLVAELEGAPSAVSICSDAAAHYRTVRDREPDVLWPRLLLARAASIAGEHSQAMSEAAAAVAMRPVEKDAKGHTDALLVQAQVLGRAGRVDEAVKLVEHLLSIPSHLSPARLRIDPEWASLRHHPRIQEIVRHAVPPVLNHWEDIGDSG